MAKSPKRNIVRVSRATSGRATQSKTAPLKTSKLDQIIGAVRASKGATLADLMRLTGWQAHSVRGALAGALRKRGLNVVAQKVGDERVYRLGGTS